MVTSSNWNNYGSHLECLNRHYTRKVMMIINIINAV